MCDPAYISLLFRLHELESLLQTNEQLQFALDSYPGQISIHYPKHKLLKEPFHLVPNSLKSKVPLKALTLLTDGSGKSQKSHKSVITWKDLNTRKWESDVQIV